jgi:hypothetical protein
VFRIQLHRAVSRIDTNPSCPLRVDLIRTAAFHQFKAFDSRRQHLTTHNIQHEELKPCHDVGDPFTQRSASITAKGHLQLKCGQESEIESTKKRMSTSDESERGVVPNSCETTMAETILARWS